MIAYYVLKRNDVKLFQIGTDGNVNLWTYSWISDTILHFKKTQKMFFCEYLLCTWSLDFELSHTEEKHG